MRVQLYICLTFFYLAAEPVLHGQQSADGQAPTATWPPDLPGAEHGTLLIESPWLLDVPESVERLRHDPSAASFTVAKTPPAVRLAFHRNLGPDAGNRRLWSSWGDICVARDGSVYCGIGDHGNAVGGDARCFVYRWDSHRKVLEQVTDMNQVVAPVKGQPAWSKIHAKIDEGPDGKIYFSCTLNDGNRAGRPEYKWNDGLPGGQLYQYDPTTRTTQVFADLPPRRCTATSLLDRRRNLWWCNLEAGEGNALWALSLSTGKVFCRTRDGSVAFNRCFALAGDGSIVFNGQNGLCRLDPKTGDIRETKSSFPDSPGIRCATPESADGFIYGMTHKTNQLFRYSPVRDELKLLGPNWLDGSYTAVCVLSDDNRFLYYLPGSHGKAFHTGTPVVQYEIATGRRKVLAFLAPTLERRCDYVPAGSYGVKLSHQGHTLCVNFNGHAADDIRPSHMRPNGFGLCAFAEIQIPEPERN